MDGERAVKIKGTRVLREHVAEGILDFVRIQEEQVRVDATAAQLRQAAEDGSLEEAARLAQTLAEAVNDLRLRCDAFTTKTGPRSDAAPDGERETAEALSEV